MASKRITRLMRENSNNENVDQDAPVTTHSGEKRQEQDKDPQPDEFRDPQSDEFQSGPEDSDDEVAKDERDKLLLDRLRRRKEILDLQCALKALEQEAAPVPRFTPSADFSEIANAVSNFSGDDAYGIRKWIADYESVVMTHNCDVHFRFLCACRLLTGTAKMFLRTITVRTWDQLKQALLDEFDRRITRQEIYSQLSRRTIRSDESVRRYIITMQELASYADVEEADLIDFIVDGLGDSTGNVAILYGATTLKQLKELLPKYERLRARAVTSAGITSTRRASGALATSALKFPSVSVTKLPSSDTSGKTAATSAIRCYNCSQYGHISAECPKEKRVPGSCFRCGKLGHLHTQCPKRKLQPGLAALAISPKEEDDFDDDNEPVLSSMQLSN